MSTVVVENGTIDIHPVRRANGRWDAEYRFVAIGGKSSDWKTASIPEGFSSQNLAFSAGVLLGQALAASSTGHRADKTW